MPKDNAIGKEYHDHIDHDGIVFSNIVSISITSLPYFRVKLSCVCLMFAYIKTRSRRPIDTKFLNFII